MHLLDCVTPRADAAAEDAAGHDNLAIVDFAPDARIVPKNKEVEFTVKVAQLLEQREEGRLPPDRGSTARSARTARSHPVGPAERRDGRQDRPRLRARRGPPDAEGEDAGRRDRFNLVSVHLEGETGGHRRGQRPLHRRRGPRPGADPDRRQQPDGPRHQGGRVVLPLEALHRADQGVRRPGQERRPTWTT